MSRTQPPTVSDLQNLSLTDLDRLARSTVAHLTQRRLMLGRYLLVLGHKGRVERLGCSGAIHYASLLNVSPKEAAECRRVAGCLEALPHLRAKAEAGRVGWCALSLITSKATPETDARWLELVQSFSYGIIKKLVRSTAVGEMPPDPDLVPELEALEGWLHLLLPSHVLVLFQQALRKVSLQARTPVSAAVCMELLVADFLAGSGSVTPEALEKMRTAARKDVAARRRPRSNQLLLEECVDDGLPSNAQLVDATVSTSGSAASPAADDEARAEEHSHASDPDGLRAPFAALAGRGGVCPSQPSLRLLVPDTDTDWANPRLRFSEEARLATPAQRQEMLRRDGYCCATPGCPNKLWLALHHVVFYCEGGVTLPENLIVVCSRCHRNIHKGRLRVTGTAPDGLQWTTRRGHFLQTPLALEPDGDFELREGIGLEGTESDTDHREPGDPDPRGPGVVDDGCRL